jgi:hypothetical protein
MAPALLSLLLGLVALTAAATVPPASAASAPAEVAAELPPARAQGSATLRWFGMAIYDARLWAPAPVTGDGSQQPLALEVRYARALKGDRIARRSIDEMRRLAPLSDEQAERWLKLLQGLIPDVRAGDRIVAVQRPNESARFFVNGRHVGDVTDPAFVPLFFAIWLSPRSSEPALRAQLIGTAP